MCFSSEPRPLIVPPFEGQRTGCGGGGGDATEWRCSTASIALKMSGVCSDELDSLKGGAAVPAWEHIFLYLSPLVLVQFVSPGFQLFAG